MFLASHLHRVHNNPAQIILMAEDIKSHWKHLKTIVDSDRERQDNRE